MARALRLPDREAHIGEEALGAAFPDQALGARVGLGGANAAGIDAQIGRVLEQRSGKLGRVHADHCTRNPRASPGVKQRSLRIRAGRQHVRSSTNRVG